MDGTDGQRYRIHRDYRTVQVHRYIGLCWEAWGYR